MSAPRWPGSVRMSTSISTLSGMTLVLVPPVMTVGANVVWVHACACRARPIGSSWQNSVRRLSSSSAALNSAPKSTPSMKRRHVSWMCVGGSYSASRRTTSAAVTSALSVRNGCDACPGVPGTVMRHQYEPFSPTMTGRRGPCGGRHLEAARLGDDVVGLHRVALVLDHVLRAPGAEVLLVGDREVDRACRAA